jgi:DNA-binding NtrC family response regulator
VDLLLVDDDETLRRIMGRVLAARGHRLRTAASATEALCLMEEQRPDLVLSDIEMPGMDGIQLLIAIQERFPGTPVVLMTACGDADRTAAAFQHGVCGYLQKPIRVEALLAGIRRFETTRSAG